MPPAESILWKHLRGRRFAGFQFRRQHPIGPFFADLACHECKIVIEVDGESHLGKECRDERRSDYLREFGWLVLRFWNTEVYEELESVLEAIYQACRRRNYPHPQPLSPEYGGEGRRAVRFSVRLRFSTGKRRCRLAARRTLTG